MVAIVAFDENMGIGFEDKLPWSPIKEDFKWFKEFTLQKKIVVGRKTAASLPLLPNRFVNVLTNSNKIEDVLMHGTVNKWFARQNITINDLINDMIICGGAQIYKLLIPQCDELYATHVNGIFPADVFFPFTINQLYDIFGKTEIVREFEGGHRVVRYHK